MRIIISDQTQTPTFLIVRVDQLNDFGGGNTSVVQILRINGKFEDDLPIYFIGTLYYEVLLDRWMLHKILSLETWNYREEAEAALMLNNYIFIDYSDE